MRAYAVIAAAGACALAAGVPARARAYEAIIVATGMVTEFCEGEEPRDVPFKATVHVPRASWPDSTHENIDVFWDYYWSGVVQTVEVGDSVVESPARLFVANVYQMHDSFASTGLDPDEYFVWKVGTGGVGIDRSLAGLGSPFVGWAYSHAEGHSSSTGCDWAWMGSKYLYGAIDEVTIEIITRPTHPIRARTNVCTEKDLFMSADARIDSYPWLARDTMAAARGRLAMRGTSSLRGTAYVGDDLILDNQASVRKAYVGGDAHVHENALAGELAPLPAPIESCACFFDVDAAFAEASIDNDNALLRGLPDFNGVDIVMNGGEAMLPVGRFHVRNLTLRNGAVLRAPGTGVADLFVSDMVQVLGGSTLGGGGQERLILVSGARLVDGTHVKIRGDSTFVGHLVAPKAPTYLQDGGRVVGTLSALELEMGARTAVIAQSWVIGMPECH